jgi:hypothetical protein
MKIKIDTNKVASKSLTTVNGVNASRFPAFVHNDSFPYTIDLTLDDGTLPYFWGSAAYHLKIAVGSISERTTYFESDVLTASNNLYQGVITANSSALIGALSDQASINADVQVCVASALGMIETILLTQTTIIADTIS